jgi:hypothetical protein
MYSICDENNAVGNTLARGHHAFRGAGDVNGTRARNEQLYRADGPPE